MEKAYITPNNLPPNRRKHTKRKSSRSIAIANTGKLLASLTLGAMIVLVSGYGFSRLSGYQRQVDLDQREESIRIREENVSGGLRLIGEQWGRIYAATSSLIEWEKRLTVRESFVTAGAEGAK